MKKYDPKSIEKKWQKYWEKNKTFEVKEDTKKQKFYSLIEFPYPSGVGLHVGHPRPFTAMDVISRKKRMEGFNVLYPIGFDAFGLPTENFAIKTGRPPAEVTAENIANFTRQLKALGYSFDWSRAVDTTDPTYYKWTQWIFLQLYKHGLAYKKNQPVNWCPKDKTGLANEEVVDGCCERCGTPVEKRDKEQWMLAITKYADKLLDGLKEVNYITPARVQQENWIGRSEGAVVRFTVIPSEARADEESLSQPIEVFTTRLDTIFSGTFLVIAPEHPLVKQLATPEQKKAVEKYVQETAQKTDIERTAEEKDKSGVFTGSYALNPATGDKMPIWIADFVLAQYGTGAVFADAHDERDFAMAKKYSLPLKVSIRPADDALWERVQKLEECFPSEGTLVNSGQFDGLTSAEAREKILPWLEQKGMARRQINFKLRDWVFSRQRYWGEPIPLVKCENCRKKKYNYILLHGFKGSSQGIFFPRLKEELEKQGHTVFAPDLPNPMQPNIEEQVKSVLEKTEINENTVIVATSLGGAVAMNLVEHLKKTIAKLVLVDCFIRPEFADRARPEVEQSFNWQFNFEKIKKNAKEIVLVVDKNFPVIPENQAREMMKAMHASAQFVEPVAQHFTNDGQEPEILKALEQTGWIPLPESELPLKLPKVEKYEPTDTGESPLSAMSDWVNTTCPRCGGPAKRETDTMPNWAGSSWYFLRYADPNNDKEFASMEKLRYWMDGNPVTPTTKEESLAHSPTDGQRSLVGASLARDDKRGGGVDWYNGGMEHTVLHLLYSRFWNQFLYDIGVVPTREPYKKRTSHGMILGPDGEKMSKSRGNVINPDEMIEQFGTDAFRAYIGFMGPFDQAVKWDTNGLVGVRRFLDRVWSLQERVIASEERAKQSPRQESKGEIAASPSAPRNDKITTLLHQTIKKVSDDIEAMHFNTAIAKLMELTNEMMKEEKISNIQYQILIQLLSPFAPHIAEELWELYGDKEILAYSPWPKFDPELAKESMITIVVQVNGKVREQLEVPADISEDEIKNQALASEKIQKWLDGKEPKKVIYVRGKLISIVV